ncbi:SUKH-4 family immunity protein [Ruania alba]|uniref:SUKH-4 family immunity protein n=1 Tax=Ruania alba TaxID=648782 RepID=UPI0015878235|nr:SUKH-4 family immunity protein [Ruania alba]
MSFHYPFSDIDLAQFEGAGLRLTPHARRLSAQQVLETWPLAWVPQVRLAWPRHCLHPDDCLRIEGQELVGKVFAVNDEDVLVELESASESCLVRSVVELSFGPAADSGESIRGGAILRTVNSSLAAFARCHLAWLRALAESWEIHLTKGPDPQRSSEQVAARFLDSVAAVDGSSPFWEDMAFQIEDLGVPTTAIHEWLVGRDGLPDC